ncbi:hypothetical protein HMN09_01315800 [Mycena chlorophos]|uniref:Mitochondrial carrier n=1 Tax=Mycena chlorophos TaxID=658473 RepID=A0A8H6RZY5_MYCCL|nr:hypothetical protein HMN09_01315800 [Mycena chlorophos]
MTSTLPPLAQAFSGAIGEFTTCASSNALVYPFALATTRLQLDSPQKAKKAGGLSGAYRILHKIVRKHGLSSLYTGLATDTGATLLSNFFYFYFYAFLRYLSTRRRLSLNPNPKAALAPHKPGLGEEILLGFVAGVMSRAISTPLNIITTRLQQEHEEDENEDEDEKEGFMGVVNKIYGEQGVQGFWRGFKTAFLLCMNPALTLAFFQVFRRILARASTGKEPNPRQAFLMGAISNSIASAIMYPLMLAKTRQYASSSSGSSLAGALRNAYLGREPSGFPSHAKSQPSVAGLYQGLETQLVKGFLSQGVTFLVKGRQVLIEEMIVWVYTRRTR